MSVGAVATSVRELAKAAWESAHRLTDPSEDPPGQGQADPWTQPTAATNAEEQSFGLNPQQPSTQTDHPLILIFLVSSRSLHLL